MEYININKTKNMRYRTFLILFLLSLSNFAYADVYEWNATRPGAGPDLTSNWRDVGNWYNATTASAAVSLPTTADDVVIKSGTNICFIDAVIGSAPVARSVTIESDAAIYNKSSLGFVGAALVIEQDLTINDGGFYFGEAETVTIKRDLIIQAGANGGSFIIVDALNEVQIGRNYVNQGTLAKRQNLNTFINLRLNGTNAAYIYADGSHNNTRNTFVQEDLSGRAGFNFNVIDVFPSGTATILKTGAFDNVVAAKIAPVKIENSGSPASLVTTGVSLPFMAGIVGDGVNDYDGSAGVDEKNKLVHAGSGNFTVLGGSIVVNDVTAGSPTDEAVTVYDQSTTHPRTGEAWAVPFADMNVRGKLEIANAQFGVSSYTGAGIDLYAATTKKDICLHVGGELRDLNILEPSGTDTERRGLYIGPYNQIYSSSAVQDRPIIVFNGFGNQIINGSVPNIRDYNNIASQGQGIVLPNVIIKKATNEEVSIGSSSNLRIFGDLTIFSGTFKVNGRKLLFGDYYLDEINVLAVGTHTNGSPDAYGIFSLEGGGTMLLCSDNSGAFLNGGAIFRGRRGSTIVFEGTAAVPVEISRESRPGGRIRLAMYSGCKFRARYSNWEWPSHWNTGYALTGTAATGYNQDNGTGGSGSIGGLKIYQGAIFYNYNTNAWDPNPSYSASNIHTLSDCAFTGSNQNNQTALTINNEGFLTIQNTILNDYIGNNANCATAKTEGEVRFVNSGGSMGGLVGEDSDIDPLETGGDRIIFDNLDVAIWVGLSGSGTRNWSDWENWKIPDQPGGSNAGTPDNPDQLVPGVAGFVDVNVVIPRRSHSHCRLDVDVILNGSLSGNTEESGAPLSGSRRDRRLYVNSGRTIEIEKDVLLYEGFRLYMYQNCEMILGSNFMANDYANGWSTNTGQSVTIYEYEGSTFTLNGISNQQFNIRHNDIYNLKVNKPSGVATLQGISGWLTWTAQYHNLIIEQGHVRPLSNTGLDIKGDFIQKAGIFEPLKSPVYFRGNFYATGGTMIAGSDVVRFHPLRPNLTPSGSQVNWEIQTTANHVFNDVEIGNRADSRMRRTEQDYLAWGWTPEIVVNGRSNSNTSEVTYNLLSNFESVGTTTIQDNRTLICEGYIMSVGDLTLENGSRLNLQSTVTTGGELQIAAGKTLNIQDGARFDMIGLPSRYVKITRADVTGEYAFTIGGIVSARYYIAEFMNTDGINLTSTASSVSPGVISYGGGGQDYVSPAVGFTSIYEGSGAAFTASIEGQKLDAIIVSNEGSGYTVVPNVTLTGGTGAAGGTATAIMQGSPIDEVVINNGGSGYTAASGEIALNFGAAPSGGTAAVGDAIINNRITAINIGVNDSYTKPPEIMIGAPVTGGEQAEAFVNLNPGSLQTGVITMLSGGAGYSASPTVTITGANGASDAVASATVSGGQITGIIIASGGTNYTFPITVIISDPTGTDAVVNDNDFALAVSQTINNIEVTQQGSGYNTGSAPSVTIASGSATATAVVTGGDEIVGLNITNNGSNYLSAPIISVAGGSGADIQATTAGGRVTAINITSGGTEKYITMPTVNIDAPPSGGTQAVANAQGLGGTVSSFTPDPGGLGATNGGRGENYRTAPIVNITDSGIGTGAAVRAKITASPVYRFNILNGGEGYPTPASITMTIKSSNGDGTATETIPTANITVEDDVIWQVSITNGGSGYSVGDVFTTTGGSGSDAKFEVTGETGGVMTRVSILDGGTGYTNGNALAFTSGGAILQVDAVRDGVITEVTTASLSGTGYTTAPDVTIVSATGEGADVKALLNQGEVTDLYLDPIENYPVASFSDGIITNTFYTGAAMTIDEAYDTYRTKANNNTDEDNLVGGVSPLVAGVTTVMHDYGSATFAGNEGPRIDTIYNVVFAKNPAVDVSGNYTLSQNVKRVGTDNDATKRIIFKNAIGGFSGEDFDEEEALTTVPAGTPNNILNPNDITTDDGNAPVPGDDKEGLVVWRDPNVKRWDGGPTNAGTAWNNPENWRPDGVPKDLHDIIIDYSLLWVDYTTDPPTLKVPDPFTIDMNSNYKTLSTATGKSLTINPLILPRVAGGTSITEPITINIQDEMRIGGTVAIGKEAVINVTQSNNLIEVGESWVNEGQFNNGNGTVTFYKNTSRTISNVLSSKDATSNLSSELNAFFNVTFSAGQTDLSTDFLAKGNITIQEGAILNSNNRFIYLESDWVNRGTFQPTQGTVYFRGNSLQNVKREIDVVDIRSAKQDFYNVVVNTTGDSKVANAENHVRLFNRVEILDNGQLTMIRGRILSDTLQELIIAENASLNMQGSPRADSYVDGPVGRIFSTQNEKLLHYPVGSSREGEGAEITVATVDASGTIQTLNIATAGEDYVVGNKFEVKTTNGRGAVLEVQAVNADGGITNMTITNGGNDYAATEELSIIPGQGTAVYVGGSSSPTEGSVELTIGLEADRETMYVVDQIEERPPVKDFSALIPINYISLDRFWKIEERAYVSSGLISTANNSLMSTSKDNRVALWFSGTNERIVVSTADGYLKDADDFASTMLADLGRAVVVKDRNVTFAALPSASGTSETMLGSGNYLNTPTATNQAEHEVETQRGVAASSGFWINAGATGNPVISSNALRVESGTFGTLDDGRFTLGFEYTGLPLEVLDITAELQENGVNVEWTTANEIYSEMYVVERSLDGENFETIGSVVATGRGRAYQNYNFIDRQPIKGWNYYRLRQLDAAGNADLSKIVSVEVLSTTSPLILFPNPALRGTNVLLKVPVAEAGETLDVQVLDLQGRVLYTTQIDYAEEGLSIPVSKFWIEGLYIIQVNALEDSYKVKLVVK